MADQLAVTGPDGKVYQFPSDASDAEITAFFDEKPAAKQESALSRFGTGLYDNLVAPAIGAAKTGATMLMNPEKAMSEAARAGGNEGVRLYDLATKGNEGHSALNWVPIVGPSLAATADKMRSGNYAGAAGDMTGMAAPALAAKGATMIAPRIEQAGMRLGRNVLKVKDATAKLATASKGGTDLEAGANEIVKTLADRGLLAPTRSNRVAAIGQREASGQNVERQALIPPERPAGVIRSDRMLPSTATSFEDIPLGDPPVPGPTMVVSPQQFRPSGGGDIRNAIRFQEGTPGGPNPARGGFQGDQVESVQYIGEGGIKDRAPHDLRGPGVLRREVPPSVVPGQPFDTVARQSVLNSIDADIAAAKGTASPTTGLEALRSRWEIMPEFVDRKTARGVVKGINMRLAPRYHNALNDPVAVASEKQVGRLVRDEMMTPEMEAANKDFAQIKPASLALSQAAKRLGNNNLISLQNIFKIMAGHELGGPKGAVLGAASAVASHPVPQAMLAQRMIRGGTTIPHVAGSDALRATILAMLAQQKQ